MYQDLKYTGAKESGTQHGLAHRVVMDLIDSYQGLGHHLYIDNFYTSPVLLSDLLRCGTLACGTVKVRTSERPEI